MHEHLWPLWSEKKWGPPPGISGTTGNCRISGSRQKFWKKFYSIPRSLRFLCDQALFQTFGLLYYRRTSVTLWYPRFLDCIITILRRISVLMAVAGVSRVVLNTFSQETSAIGSFPVEILPRADQDLQARVDIEPLFPKNCHGNTCRDAWTTTWIQLKSASKCSWSRACL